MIDLKRLLDEALTIPADKAGPVELKLRDVLSKRRDCKYEDVIVKCCRSDENGGKLEPKQLTQTYIVGLGNIIDLLKVYDKCKDEYIQQKLDKKIQLERADGKVVQLDPLKDLNKISRLPALKQFIENFEKLVSNDTSISTSFKKYAINDYDRKCIRLLCWNSRVMVWGTREFEPSQKFAVQLWQNIETIDSGSAYGEPEEQCPYCTHSKNHWDNHSGGDSSYEQYWYLKIPSGVSPAKRGNLNTPEVVKIYNALKGLGPDILVCQHDSNNDWCDRDDNPISEYGVDIHDAGETIYLNDDGEPVDDPDEDGYDEELEFVFGPDKEDFYSDVVELYDKWFAERDADKNLPKQPWETERQYQQRRDKDATFVGFVDDEDSDSEKHKKEFDFEKEVWTSPINLDSKHFKDGILAIQLPQVTNCWLKIENAEIASFAGFPKSFVGDGSNKAIKLENCHLKSISDWTPTKETKNGLALDFSSCTIDDTFKVGDALGGASLEKLVVYGGTTGESKTITDFKFLGGVSKLKNIKELTVSNSEVVKSFEGLAESIEDQKIQKVFIWGYNYHSKEFKIESFRGLPSQIDDLTINDLLTTQEAAKDAISIFPQVSQKLNLSVKNTEQEILAPLFRAVWSKAQDSCDFDYHESGKHVFDAVNSKPIFDVLTEDKTQSRFKGLARKKFSKIRMNLDLSPRNLYEEKAFLSGDSGFSGGAREFDPTKIPLFQNESKLFTLRHGEYYMQDSIYAMVDAGKIICFSPSLEMTTGPFGRYEEDRRDSSWYCVSFDDGEHGKDFSLDEALKVFLETRKSDFPITSTLVLGKGFTGKSISDVDEPDLTLKLSRNGCPNLVEVSRCKLAAFSDERGKTLNWDDKMSFESQTVFRDCMFTEESLLEAKAVHNCSLTQPEKDANWITRRRGIPAIKVCASEGIFNTKLSSSSLAVEVVSPVIEGCIIESGGRSIRVNNLSKLARTTLRAKFGIDLFVQPDFSIARDCQLEITGEKSSGTRIDVCGMSSKQKVNPKNCDEIASSLVSCLRGEELQTLDLDSLDGIKSLKFLEQISPKMKRIMEVELKMDSIEDFRFKLQTPGQVASLGYAYHATPHLDHISKDATLDGFDASVALGFGYCHPTQLEKYDSKVLRQFAKYFTKYASKSGFISYAMFADPNYTDKNGQFTAPKTLAENLFGRPTTTEENSWLRVMKLFD